MLVCVYTYIIIHIHVCIYTDQNSTNNPPPLIVCVYIPTNPPNQLRLADRIESKTQSNRPPPSNNNPLKNKQTNRRIRIANQPKKITHTHTRTPHPQKITGFRSRARSTPSPRPITSTGTPSSRSTSTASRRRVYRYRYMCVCVCMSCVYI